MLCIHRLAPMMEAVRTSETSVYFNETTRHYIPEGHYLDLEVLTASIIRPSSWNFSQFLPDYTVQYPRRWSTTQVYKVNHASVLNWVGGGQVNKLDGS
jgi:hypothetical protein